MAAPLRAPDPLSPFEQLRLAREIVRTEGQTLLALADRLGEEFCHAVALLASIRGSVIVDVCFNWNAQPFSASQRSHSRRFRPPAR
jgi:hypothetical protein